MYISEIDDILDQTLDKFMYSWILENNITELISFDKLIKESKQKNKYVSNLLVILIQVHSRLNYLKELVSSLNETKHINETLVIFSHDLIDEKINDFIKTIDFCAVLQIYYPYSLQIYPDEFPGKDPNDCPTKIEKKKY